MNYFVNPQKNVEKLKDEASGRIKNIDVATLIKRSFKSEQTDILEDERFQSLVDHSVELNAPESLEAGKDNPFERN